jgi:hypothetical protein
MVGPMRQTLFSLLSVVALASTLSITGFAAEKPAKEKPKAPGEVVSVDDKSITVVAYGKKEVKYTVTDATKVTVDHKPGKISDVHMGMKAQVGHKAAATPGGEEEATSISATSPPKKAGK